MVLKHDPISVMERLPIAAVVSKTESNEIIWMNRVASAFFGFEKIPEHTTSIQLLKLNQEELEWYTSLNLSARVTRFQPITLGGGYDFSIVLDCSYIERQGETYRLDTFNTKNYDVLPVYDQYCYCFEECSFKLENIYKGIGRLEENIADILDLVMYVYAGDRASIYEVDRELCCTVDLYVRNRKGFKGENEKKYKSIDIATANKLLNRIENGESYHVVTDNAPANYVRDRMEKGRVVRTMACPFTRRSGIKCFLRIDNPRRFYGWDSFLRFASYLLANDIHSDKIQGYLDASYLLNKSLASSASNRIKIYMFGGFEIQTPNGILQDGSFRSPQVCALIAFLLLNQKRMLSIYEISEAIWPDQIIDNPYNQIKNVVFRARKALEGVCDKSLIEANEGTYAINSKLDIWLDIEEFERLCKKASNEELPDEQRINLYQQAFKLYRGGMLPFLEADLWLLTRINYYQILYTNMVNEYLNLLTENNRYTEAFAIASTAIGIEPTNFEAYNILIQSLVRNNHYDLARKYYQKISRRMAKNQREQFCLFWKDLIEDS